MIYSHPLTTFGCQMNEHDSERMKGMLESLGYEEAVEHDGADLILFNTCSIRESADNRLIGNLGEAKRLKSEDPSRIVGVAQPAHSGWQWFHDPGYRCCLGTDMPAVPAKPIESRSCERTIDRHRGEAGRSLP